jgi:hypothetical protein
MKPTSSWPRQGRKHRRIEPDERLVTKLVGILEKAGDDLESALEGEEELDPESSAMLPV